ncbi:MAG: hypothetical protein AAGB27_02890 [Pseudomonadota bacterium]
MRVNAIALGACFYLTLSSAFAAGYQTAIDQFFERFGNGEVAKAVDGVYSSNPWIDVNGEAVSNVRNQLLNINSLVGDFNGQVLLDETLVKNVYVHVTYLALFDRQPVRMEFQYYKPKDRWMVFSFAFDVNWDEELEQAVREKIARGN